MAATFLARHAPTVGQEIGSPRDFVLALHPSHRDRQRIFLVQLDGETARHVPMHSALDYVRADLIEGEESWYVSLNEFRSWRTNDQVVCLKNAFVDIDCHGPADPAPEVALASALETLERLQLPLPQIRTMTGRGVQLIWNLQRIGIPKAAPSSTALVRWRLLQQHLATLVGGRLADQAVSDPARVVRLAGTVNAASRTMARSYWVSDAAPYDFHQLCDAVLPVFRAKLRADRLARARKKAEAAPALSDAIPVAIETVAEQLATAMPDSTQRLLEMPGLLGNLVRCCDAGLKDLDKILHACQVVGVPVGFRDKCLFLSAVFMAWTTPFSQMHRFADAVIERAQLSGLVADGRTAPAWRGRVNEPLTVAEARAAISTVVRKAKQAATRHNETFGGRRRDPRYYYKRSTLWAELGPLVAQLRLVDEMQLITPANQHRRIRNTKDARPRDRVAEGRYKRHHPSHHQRIDAIERFNAGTPVREIAEQLGVTPQTIRNWLRRPSNTAPTHPAKNHPPSICPEGAGCGAGIGADATQAPPSEYQDLFPTMVGQPECGQVEDLSITEGVSPSSVVNLGSRRPVHSPRAVGSQVLHTGENSKAVESGTADEEKPSNVVPLRPSHAERGGVRGGDGELDTS